MAQSLFTILTLASIVSAAPFAVRQEAPSTTSVPCAYTYWSVSGDNCDTIASKNGVSVEAITNANSFVNCGDVWTNTPICVPYAPAITSTVVVFDPIFTTYVPNCAYTYTSVAGDTCETIGAANGQSGTAIYNANTFLNCADIWVGTPICVPPSSITYSPPDTQTFSFETFSPIFTTYIPNCAYTYTSVAGDTCDSIGANNGQSGSAIHDANTFLDCNNIWVGTPICVPPASTTISATPTGTITFDPIFTTYIPNCDYTYISRAGDTCDSIGAANGQSGTAIHDANSFLDCNDIWVGTPVCVPPNSTTFPIVTVTSVPQVCQEHYTSAPGDTCDTIGAHYGVSGLDIFDSNTFLNCDDIWAYTPICIPLPRGPGYSRRAE